MSKRKQAAVEAAKQAAEQKAIQADGEKNSFYRKAQNPIMLAVVIVAVLALGAVSATVGSGSNIGWFNAFTIATSSLQPTGANPSTSTTPQLSREYVYAGSRMLAVEDANAPSSSNQPTDLVVWRSTTGTWHILDSNGAGTSGLAWGGSGDIPKPADFDGDGLYDFCVFRPDNTAQTGTFYIQPNNSSGSYYAVQFGLHTDLPVPADYDGDGRADVAVYRPSNSTFYIQTSSSNTTLSMTIGQNNATPLPADYDGDGRVDPAVYKLLGNNTYEWTLYNSTTNQTLNSFPYGDVPNGDIPATGDFNGDGLFDVAVRRVGTNEWIIRNVGTLSLNISGFTMQSADIPVAGDYDGDSKTDAAVWRPANGTWYIRKSTNGQMRVEQWGQSGDTPVPAPFRR